MLWKDARELGMGYWVKNLETVRKLAETIARNQFLLNDEKDPTRCGLLYLALKKRKVWAGLWRTANQHPEQQAMLKFLANDFTQQRWQSAALKNAFVLLGKQRNEYAATLFLLADKLKDAVSVCVKQLDDPQLAILICRLYEGDDSELAKQVYRECVLKNALDRNDRWTASLAFSSLKDDVKSLTALFDPLSSLTGESVRPSIDGVALQNMESDGNIILLALSLSNKKAIRMRFQEGSKRSLKNLLKRLLFDAIDVYDRLGCTPLAMELLLEEHQLLGFLNAADLSGVTGLEFGNPSVRDTLDGWIIQPQQQPQPPTAPVCPF
jgi:hypothetical protein